MYKYKNSILIVLLLIFGNQVLAKSSGNEIEVGFGLNSYTGGRSVISSELSYLFSGHAVTWAATGVQSQYYYQASHLLFYFWTWDAGSMWGGDVTAGFGAGAGYSVRGFQDEGSSTESTSSDQVGGPAIRLNWSYGPVYINFSTVYGLREWSKHLLGLNFQDVETLSLGFRF